MDICHPHNLIDKDGSKTLRFGIRVSVDASDPFSGLVGTDWEKFHWFDTEAERDRVLADMSSEHIYSRIGDKPTLIFGTVER